MPRPMTTLMQQQQALLDALFTWPRDKDTNNIANYIIHTGARGLKSYQAHGHMLADRTLRGTYPVLAKLLGVDSFAGLARAFWHAHPPARGDLAQWGGELAGFVQASDQLRDEPYLGDVARVEWDLHTCAGASDRAAEPVTFQLLMAHDPATLRLVLAPGCSVLRSAWPVVSIVTAHQHAGIHTRGVGDATDTLAGNAQAGPQVDPHGDVRGDGRGARHGQVHSPVQPALTLAAVSAKLRDGVAESAVVWRAGYQPQLRAAVPGEAQLLTALLAGRSLGEAVQSAVASAVKSAGALDFNAWLPVAVQSGLLLGAERVEAGTAG